MMVVSGNRARHQGALIPDSPDNKPIEGGFASSSSISTTEGEHFDQVLNGSDSDQWHYQANILSKVVKGNSDAVVIGHYKRPDDVGLGRDLSSTVTSKTESTVTLLFVRTVPIFNRDASEYPIACIDRYRIVDGDTGSVQYDANIVEVAKPVFVAKKVN